MIRVRQGPGHVLGAERQVGSGCIRTIGSRDSLRLEQEEEYLLAHLESSPRQHQDPHSLTKCLCANYEKTALPCRTKKNKKVPSSQGAWLGPSPLWGSRHPIQLYLQALPETLSASLAPMFNTEQTLGQCY